ncbi:MAG: glycosyltransferase family 4 protein [Anaerolineales bacterium]|nr:glycosyltransferase family 4 protein [Anaerolineales bacterium]
MPEKPLHIGFLTNEYIIPPNKLAGGLATYIQKVGRELVSRGHHVSVFYLSERNYEWEDQGVKIYEVDIRGGGIKFLGIRLLLERFFTPIIVLANISDWSNRLAKKVWQVNAITPLDIAQVPSWECPGIALIRNGVFPLVCRISSIWALYRNAQGLKNSLSTAIYKWYEIYQVEQSDGVYSPSHLTAWYLSQLSSIQPRIINTPFPGIVEGLDDSFYLDNLSGKKYLLYFGTLKRLKGIQVVSRAISHILSDFPDIHFVFIGETAMADNDCTFAEQVFIENDSFHTNIHYYPSLPKELLFPVVKNAYGILIPSLFENYSNACLEAQQFGRIVIGTRGTSLQEVIEDDETGFLVERNNVESLVEGIRRLLLLSPQQKREMESKIHDHVESMLSQDRVGELISYYREVIRAFEPNRKKNKNSLLNLLLFDDPETSFCGLILNRLAKNRRSR